MWKPSIKQQRAAMYTLPSGSTKMGAVKSGVDGTWKVPLALGSS